MREEEAESIVHRTASHLLLTPTKRAANFLPSRTSRPIIPLVQDRQTARLGVGRSGGTEEARVKAS
jgi:hypothetical protein